MRFFRFIPEEGIGEAPLKDTLKEYIRLYRTVLVKSIYVNALSAPLFFTCGSQYYIYFKYGRVPAMQSDDYLVLITGIIFSYGISVMAQLAYGNFSVKQLEPGLEDLDEAELVQSSIRIQKNKKRVWKMAMVLLLVRGARTMGDAAKFDARFKSRLGRIILSALGMGATLLIASTVMQPFFGIPTLRYLALLGLVVIGIVSYFGLGHLTGAFRLSEFKRNLRR